MTGVVGRFNHTQDVWLNTTLWTHHKVFKNSPSSSHTHPFHFVFLGPVTGMKIGGRRMGGLKRWRLMREHRSLMQFNHYLQTRLSTTKNWPVTSRWKETFWPPASQLYSPASALPACCTTSLLVQPLASTRTFELELSFFPSLYHVTSVWAWATSQLSVALAPAIACTSLRAGCSLANTTEGSGDRGGYTGSETPFMSRCNTEKRMIKQGGKKTGNFSRLCTSSVT